MMADGTRLCHFDEAVFLGGAVEFEQGFEQRAHLRQRPRVGTVAEPFLLLRMGFPEMPVYAHPNRPAIQHRADFALAAPAAAPTAPPLPRMGRTEHHRDPLFATTRGATHCTAP